MDPVRHFLCRLGLVATGFPASAFGQTQLFSDLHDMVPFEGGSALALGDVDGDGDLDALVTGPGCRLWLNHGTGVLRRAVGQVPPLPTQAQAVALGDVDGDGDLDGWVGLYGGSGPMNRLLLNDGQGLFSDGTGQLSSLPLPTAAIALADVDGDGDLDAVVGNGCGTLPCSAPYLRLLLNDGSGVFADATAQLPPVSATVASVSNGDVDGDGDLDLLFSGAAVGTTTSRLFLNSGAGVFSDATPQIPPVLSLVYGLAMGDVDGDGDLDAVLGGYVGSCLPYGCAGAPETLWLNDGSGVFSDASVQIPGANDFTTSVSLADVDGDGDLDLLTGNTGACPRSGCFNALNRLYLNDGAGVFSDASGQIPALPGWTYALAVGDLDGDGDADILVGNGNGQRNRLYLNGGSVMFFDETSPNGPLPPPVDAYYVQPFGASVEVGDVDGDGDSDLVAGLTTLPAGGPIHLYLNQNNGAFVDAAGPIPAPSGTLAPRVKLGDLDGDGDLDILAGTEAPAWVFLNQGTGTFAFGGFLSALAPYGARDFVPGDVDGDGDLDVLVVAYGSFAVPALYLNDGSAAFTGAYGQFPPINHFTLAGALGDVDSDGDLDALLGNGGFPTPQPDLLYLNDGSGTFSSSVPAFPSDGARTRAVALGDVDGDGDLDAYLGNEGLDRLGLNDGSGAFTLAVGQITPPASGSTVVALEDVDQDGDLDVLVGSAAQLFLNDGGGFFSEAPALLPPAPLAAGDFAFDDLDGDGDLDAVLALGSAPRVLWNLTRQLAWRGLPRIGKPVTFDLHGPAWGAWFLVASAGTGNTPLPPLGVIRLDLATLMPQLGGLLDAQGHVAITYQVPAMPALVGQSLYWQAVVVGPARLTNLERTTFTNL